MFTRRVDSASGSAPVVPAPPTRPPAPPQSAADVAAAKPNPDAIPGEHIVVFQPGVTRSEQAAILQAVRPTAIEELPLVNGMLVKTDPARAFDLDALADAPGSKVSYVQPNYRQHLRGCEGAATPLPPSEVAAATTRAREHAGPGGPAGDPLWEKQYHLENHGQTNGRPGVDVKAAKAWEQSTGSGVIVAVADTNIDIEHEDLAPNVWTNPGEIAGNGIDDDHNGYVDDVHGWNWSASSNRPQDGNQSHGTHTAGLVAAAMGNGKGSAGVAPGAKIMPLSVLTRDSTTANAIKAFAYAVANGANVISNSWGNNTFEPALAEAVKKTTDAGVSVVVASGNEHWDTGIHGSYPDNYPGSISVAASNKYDNKPTYSNFGTVTVDLAAPGDEIFSTLPGGRYGYMSGTSMAAPVVSGIIALVKARYPQLSRQEVEQRVLRSVQRYGTAAAWNTLVASGGRADAEAALTPIAAPGAPYPTDGAVVGSPVRVDWNADLLDGQRFHVQVSTNVDASSAVSEDFESGAANRAFTMSGDKPWKIDDAIARSGSKSFNVEGLTYNHSARLELTETITEPTELSFDYTAGRGGELSFFINRDLQFEPVYGEGWKQFRTTLQPGTYTFTWLAAGASRQSSPIAIDGLRIGNVSDATWTDLGTTEPGTTGMFWTPDAATESAAVRVKADNGRFEGDWVAGDPFEVVLKSGGKRP